MTLERKLSNWTSPSSDAEQEKQERTERMVRAAVADHSPFATCQLRVYAKGSYPNNTNVRADSDVDIAVECTEVEYWDEAAPGAAGGGSGSPYVGGWTPDRLRAELLAALTRKFPGDVDSSGSTAILVQSSSARVDSDVVPCFTYRYYLSPDSSRIGTRIFRKDGGQIDNFPEQQLSLGRVKNLRTQYAYKKTVRILKRIENAMRTTGEFRALPSYFVECLTYNCPDSVFLAATWTDTVRGVLSHVWESLQGDEPVHEASRWVEVNECFYLFHPAQAWTRADGRDFAQAAWAHLGL
ncbi:nucleotidyltransferase domain-containing protein [Lysobacter enzymogenes]|uniref:cGAS/DncV-like nucleotidyltransferase C-terminal helical domain-containing protein n=1 Tax=Lysobacter enzymogenes TaxID=69 RepID=A0AAU9APV6_LYSEN|nr:nucleotidyltransferase [Lysobacter enzymogenes]BAV98613.1 conserved hypothetical protein [Lysobacter enzymogenes]